MTQHALLFDRGRFRVALGDDQPAQRGAVLARNLLPYILPETVAESDLAVRVAFGEEDSPAVLGHTNKTVRRPAFGIDRSRRAQVHVGDLEIARAEFLPPVEKLRLPMLQRALQNAVGAKIDVIRNALGVIDGHGINPFRLWPFALGL